MEFLLVLRYLLMLAVFTSLGAPIAALVFREFPRRGAAFSLPTALIPFAIVVFWIGQLTFGLHTILIGIVVLIAGAFIAHRLGGQPKWDSVAVMYGVFIVGFSILVVVRAASPSITPAGGEQFLHFGLVKSLERAPGLPPEDFWYAGEPLKYYYGGQLQVTSFSMLTGTKLRYGFNLGIATFYGVMFVVAYGLTGAIVENRGYSHRFGGALGTFFVAVGGGTTTATRLLTPYLPDGVADVVSPAAFGFVATRFNNGALSRTIAELATPSEWSWWYTRYVVPGTLQEVPLYSFVKGDLHGQTLSTGYVLFAGAVAYAYYTAPKNARRRRATILFGGLGAIGGVFGFMNTWALPTVGGLTVLTVGAAEAHPATLLPERYADRLHIDIGNTDTRPGWLIAELWRLLLAGVGAVIVLLISITIASPFLLFGDVPTNNGIGIFPPRSPLGPFLVIYAGLFALFAAYGITRGWPIIEGTNRRSLTLGILALLVTMVGTVVWLDFAVLAVTGPLLLGGWLLVRSGRGDFALILLIAGAGLLLSFELVYARLPQIGNPRWNTSLKVAVQGWTLGAAGGGAAAAILVTRSWDRLSDFRVPNSALAGDGTLTSWRVALASSATIALVTMVVLASLAFPVMALNQEVARDAVEGDYDPTLDGRADLEQRRPAQATAIDWLDDRPGTPTIVEAPGPSYQWTSPASTFTGLPSVIGWDHQEEYRSPEAYTRRVTAVDEIYTGEWTDAAQYLDRYEVQYVYVGPNERERYGDELRSFDRSVFTVAFENEAVTIYAVEETQLLNPSMEDSKQTRAFPSMNP